MAALLPQLAVRDGSLTLRPITAPNRRESSDGSAAAVGGGGGGPGESEAEEQALRALSSDGGAAGLMDTDASGAEDALSPARPRTADARGRRAAPPEFTETEETETETVTETDFLDEGGAAAAAAGAAKKRERRAPVAFRCGKRHAGKLYLVCLRPQPDGGTIVFTATQVGGGVSPTEAPETRTLRIPASQARTTSLDDMLGLLV